MNKCTIIGNLTRAPELRQTQDGIPVCNFTVAVNRRVRSGGQPEADYFRVTAWRGLGENCAKYLDKGRKVAAIGTVSARPYTGSDNTVHASIELVADEVEFLSPKASGGADGFTPVDDADLPEEFQR